MQKRIDQPASSRQTLRILRSATLLSSVLFVAGCSSDVMRFDGYATEFNGQEQTSSVRSSQNALLPSVGVDNPSQGGYQDRSFASAPLAQDNQHSYNNQQPVTSPFQVRNEQPAGFEGERFQRFVTVQPGDSLQSIAAEHRVSAEALASQNGLRMSDPLFTGQQLSVPGAPSTAQQPQYAAQPNYTQPQIAQSQVPQATQGGTYTVQSGDTLYGIARRHNMTVADLAAKNGMSTNSNVRIGQQINISGSSTQMAAATQTRQTASDVQPGYTQPQQQTSVSDQPLNKQAETISRQPATQQPDREVRVVAPNPAAQESPLVKQVSIEPDQAPAERIPASFRWPATGRVVSEFGKRPDGTHNDGINIAVPEGTPVKAAENGVVVYAGDEIKGYGNLVLVRHADDYVTAYAHAKDILVKRGDTVTRGQDIATAGSTGAVSSPQVHFEIRKGAKPVDPKGYLKG